MVSKLWLVLGVLGLPLLGVASVRNVGLQVLREGPRAIESREQPAWKAAGRDSQFAEIPRAVARWRCRETRPPEALTTPDPLLDGVDSGSRVTVSFIIGTDGRVHSPFILESAGAAEDRSVLEAVSSWRYRPAMCNGVPTETEGKVEFSRR
jgi:TonB family protein